MELLSDVRVAGAVALHGHVVNLKDHVCFMHGRKHPSVSKSSALAFDPVCAPKKRPIAIESYSIRS